MHHYKECGLPNVWLANGYTVKQTPYGEAVSVIEADKLAAVLAKDVACKKGRLTGREFWYLRTALCLSQKALASLLGATEQSVSLWERKGRAPKASEALLRAFVLEHFDGNHKIRDLVDRINTVERIVNQKIIAKERGHAWTAKLAAAEEPVEEAVPA